eukprot:15048800-Ditylum_brightwellii.AAC.2
MNLLCPNTGELKCRLDSTLPHLPTVPEGSNRNTEPKSCQLHLWAAWEEVQDKVKPAGCRRGV